MNDKIKQALKGAIEQAKRDRENESKTIRDGVMKAIKGDLVKVFAPFLAEIKNSSRMSAEELKRIISESVRVEVPQSDITPVSDAIYEAFQNLQFPEPKTPVVNYTPPAINIPDIRMPEKMTVEGWVGLMGVDLNNPLPVQLRDAEGKPVKLFENLTQLVSSSGGGRGFRHVIVDNLSDISLTSSGLTDAELRASSVPVEQVSGSNWSVYLTGALSTVGVVTINPDGDPTYASSTSGLTDAELRASSVPVTQASDALWSVQVKEIFGSTITSLLNGDNRIPVSVETGGSGLTDAELRASSVQVEQVSGSMWSTEVKNTVTVDGSGVTQPVSGTVSVSGTITSTGAYLLNGDGTYRDSIPVTGAFYQATQPVSGTFWQATQPVSGTVTVQDGGGALTVDGTVAVSGVTGTVGANIVDSSGIAYSGSNPVPTNLATALDQTIDSISANQVSGANFSVYVTGSSGTVVSYLVDGDGVYRDSIPVEDGGGSLTVDGTVAVSGLTGSVVAVGAVASDEAGTDSAPLKVGGIARTANPTAVAGGDIVSASYDDIGRQLTRPVQVRDLMATAYISLSTGTETTLLAGSASTFHDLVYVMGANQSDVAVLVDFRCGTAGSVVLSLEIPASGTAGIACPVPLPMPEVAQSWTADMGDITGTTVDITALFSKEV